MIWKPGKVIVVICVGVGLLMASGRGDAGTSNASELLRLAKEKFGTLTRAEEQLFQAIAIEKVSDYSAEGKQNNDPSTAEEWGEARVLKADRIRWLCTNPKASGLVGTRGILVKGARIEGKLDLLFGKVLFPLYFENCALPGGIDLRKAEVRALYLGGTHVSVIEADGLKVEGDVFLDRGFKSEGGVVLRGATIGGNLQCDGSQFINAGGTALNADRLTVEGSSYSVKDSGQKAKFGLLARKLAGFLFVKVGSSSMKGEKLLMQTVSRSGAMSLCGKGSKPRVR